MLGERLQYLRLEKGMTQKELSKVFKVMNKIEPSQIYI